MLRLPSKDIVLIGAGHTNLHVVRMWGQARIPDTQLTLVSPTSVATYSGMMPGTIAGLYRPDEMLIDLRQLTAKNHVRLIVSACEGLNIENNSVRLSNRPDMRFDVACVGVGSIPAGYTLAEQHPGFINIKPMVSLMERLNTATQAEPREHLRVAVVGAGAAGVEIAFCMQQYLRRIGRPGAVTLIDAHAVILKSYRLRTRRFVETQLNQRGILTLCSRRIVGCRGKELQFECGASHEADLVVWCAGAAPPPLLAELDLPRSKHGFLLTDRMLQSVSGSPIFAVGDSGEIENGWLPRAGVYAVRQGPVLLENLRRFLSGQSLTEFRPQRDFLSLLATGDGRAVLQWRWMSCYGKWCWQLKNRIDQKFLQMHQIGALDLTTVSPNARTRETNKMPNTMPLAGTHRPMRCQGSGGKTSGRVIHKVLSRLRLENVGESEPSYLQNEDAAVLTQTDGPVDVVSVDFFEAFLDEPWLMGRIAALHALSDLWARGVRPVSAVALVTLPEGHADAQSELLYQLLSGGIQELRRASATLVGGHTVDGEFLSVGFTVLGQTDNQECFSKSHCREGDRLILTRPLGTGVLLAAHALLKANGKAIDGMLESMLRGNASASQIARKHNLRCVTDVTGFGLAGHLLEMLNASDATARLALATVPLLSFAGDYFQQGIRSSLDAENRWCEESLHAVRPELRQWPQWAALFDPQTSGGLILAVPPRQEADVLRDLMNGGDRLAVTIGEVTATGTRQPGIVVDVTTPE